MRSLSLCSFLCLQLLLSLSYSIAFPSCRPDQSSALLDFKNSFSIQKSLPSSFISKICDDIEMNISHTNITTWRNGTNCCLWDGVTCNPSGHVIELDLTCSRLHGKLLPNNSLFHLTHLQSLDLSDNDFLGSHIPSNISQLVSLTDLSLMNCNFSGEIPSQISRLHKLVSFSLSTHFNHLILRENTWERLTRNVTHIEGLYLKGVDMSSISSRHLLKNVSSSLVHLWLPFTGLRGNLDEKLFSFARLTMIILSDNPNLIGYLPLESNWSNSIGFLDVHHTGFTGKLPHSIGQMKSLDLLDISSCKFTGEIPPSFENLTQLTILDLSKNNFSGQISSLFNLQNLVHLEELDVSNNKLSGPIPRSVFHLQNLTFLNFSHNFLSGDLLLHHLSWKSLYVLDLSSNFLQGELHSSICNATTLDIINLSHNNFTGTIPQCIVSSNQNLSVLDLQSNSFNGTVPESFEVGNNLRTLNLNGNFLEGPLPRSLVNCTRLKVLDLGNNGIEDVFPDWLQALGELQVLVLRGNKLHGFIPNFKDNKSHSFHKLRVLDLSGNNLKGPLPASFFKSFEAVKKLEGRTNLEYLYNHDNRSGGYYQDSIELTWKGLDIHLEKILTVFTSIDLSNNMFEGEIPQVVGELRSLIGLNFSHNGLTGAIPSSIGNLRNLEWLDLSSNNLTGKFLQR